MLRLVIGVCGLLTLGVWGCGSQETATLDVRVVEGVAVVATQAAADGSLTPPCLGLSAARDGSRIVFRREPDTRGTRLLTFGRRGAQTGYGVYGIFDRKNPIAVNEPLEGETIPWPDRDHRAALVYLLELSGIAPESATRIVDAHADVWFRAGLRAFVVAPLREDDDLPGTARLAVVVIEL